MAIYKYSSDSLIDEVEIITNEQGGCRAYLHASGTADPKRLFAIQQSLLDYGWVGIPFSQKGRPMLEVRGFTKPAQFHAYLQQTGCVNDAPISVTASPEDKQSAWDKFKAATLKYSGLSYILGDGAFMFYAGRELHQHYKDQKAAQAASAELEALNGKLHASGGVGIEKELANIRGKYRVLEKVTQSTDDAATVISKAEELVTHGKANIQGGKFKILSGIGYGVGSVILAIFGSKDQSHIQIKNSIGEIERFIKTEGLSDPNSKEILRQEPERKGKSIFDRGYELLSRYPSEALNIVYTGVGLALMGASFKQIGTLNSKVRSLKNIAEKADNLKDLKQERMTEIVDVGLGAVTASSALAGILIKEKKPIEGEKKREGIAGVWDWIQEKPLRATGYGYMVATGVHGVATWMKWKPLKGELPDELRSRRITLGGRGVFIGVNILAETLMAISSKGHGEGVKNRDIDTTVIASTAEFISKQNPDMQDALIARLAGYMASPHVLGGKSEQILAELRSQVAALKENPWAHTPQPHTPEVAAEIAQREQAQQQAMTGGPSTKVEGVQREGIVLQKQLATAVS